MHLIQYIIKRIAMLIPVLLGVTIITFATSHIVPSNPALVALGPHATPETVEALQKKWGLDKPVPVQYLRYLKGLLHGDLGTSLHTNRPVAKDLAAFFPATFELTTASMFICLLMGIPIGILSAVKKDKLVDHITRFISLIGVSVPVFWLGLLMLLAFYLNADIFPGGGRISPLSEPPVRVTGLYTIDSLLAGDWALFKESLMHLALPSICLGFAVTGIIARMMRSSMLNILREDFIKTAKAKGLSNVKVIFQHALRNAILPVLTVAGILYGQLLAGAILTETIFSWPGMGLYTVNSIMHMDFQPVMGFTILVATLYVSLNLIIDILYLVLDPRIRLE
jgi:peptide/nickel transport system permease protein